MSLSALRLLQQRQCCLYRRTAILRHTVICPSTALNLGARMTTGCDGPTMHSSVGSWTATPKVMDALGYNLLWKQKVKFQSLKQRPEDPIDCRLTMQLAGDKTDASAKQEGRQLQHSANNGLLNCSTLKHPVCRKCRNGKRQQHYWGLCRGDFGIYPSIPTCPSRTMLMSYCKFRGSSIPMKPELLPPKRRRLYQRLPRNMYGLGSRAWGMESKMEPATLNPKP